MNSNAATLTVNTPAAAPTITTQPINQTVTAGQTATFSVTCTGTAPAELSVEEERSSYQRRDIGFLHDTSDGSRR